MSSYGQIWLEGAPHLPESPYAVFLLLSDLHFGADLLAEAEGTLFSTPTWLKVRDYRIQRFLGKRCVAHDINIVKSLPRYLKRLLEDLSEQGPTRDDFDLYLILGDMATRPCADSYHFLRNYLTRTEYETGDSELKHVCAGLNLRTDRLVAIPGNHDKLLLSDLQLYQKEFARRLDLPTAPGPQSCFFSHRRVHDHDFLFIQVEASKYASQDNTLDLSCREHLAGGEITPDLDQEIKTGLQQVKDGAKVDGISRDNFSRAMKILLVHYAVDTNRVAGSNHLEHLILPHACRGLEKLVSDLDSDIDLVIHGHLHKAMLYKHGRVPVIAATTTTQRNPQGENGFFLVKFFRSGEVRAEHHRWLVTGFLRDDRAELSQILSGPKADAASLG